MELIGKDFKIKNKKQDNKNNNCKSRSTLLKEKYSIQVLLAFPFIPFKCLWINSNICFALM